MKQCKLEFGNVVFYVSYYYEIQFGENLHGLNSQK